MRGDRGLLRGECGERFLCAVTAAGCAVPAVEVAVCARPAAECAVTAVVCAVNVEQCFGAVRKCVRSICSADDYLRMYDTTCSIWVPFICSASVWVVSSWWGIL